MRNSLVKKFKKLTDQDKLDNQIINLFITGLNIDQISMRLRITQGVIHRLLKSKLNS